MKWIKTTGSNSYQLVVPDVEPFTPDQISVSVTEEGHLVVRATHEEKDEGDGTISRNYQGRTVLPVDADGNTVESWLTDKGILIIKANRKQALFRGRIIPVFPADPKRHLSDHPNVAPGGP